MANGYVETLRIISVAWVISVLATPVLAAGLPKKAKPFSAGEVTAVYSGNRIEWKQGAGYLAPDGNMTAYWAKPGVTTLAPQVVPGDKATAQVQAIKTKLGK